MSNETIDTIVFWVTLVMSITATIVVVKAMIDYWKGYFR